MYVWVTQIKASCKINSIILISAGIFCNEFLVTLAEWEDLVYYVWRPFIDLFGNSVYWHEGEKLNFIPNRISTVLLFIAVSLRGAIIRFFSFIIFDDCYLNFPALCL